MNKEDALRGLRDILDDFLVYNRLIPELVDIVAKSGNEKAFFQCLINRLTFLSRYGIRAAGQHEEFEIIGDGLCSIHLDKKSFNIRILYSFMPDHRPVLLLGFYERAGKKKTDYTPYLEPAKQRFRELKGEK
jgi:hypothetical protein